MIVSPDTVTGTGILSIPSLVVITETCFPGSITSSVLMLNVPSSLTLPVPITLPASFLTVTTSPAFPLPATIVLSELPSGNVLAVTSVGFVGSVLAVTTASVGSLSASSLVTTTWILSFSAIGLLVVIVNVPSSPTTPVPISLPELSFTVTVSPAAALPVTVVELLVPSLALIVTAVTAVGEAGWIKGLPFWKLFCSTVASTASLDSPPFVASTETFVASASGLVVFISKLPASLATPVPISLPKLSLIVTVAPGVALPVMIVSWLLVLSSVLVSALMLVGFGNLIFSPIAYTVVSVSKIVSAVTTVPLPSAWVFHSLNE